jgi:hypothetical protein
MITIQQRLDKKKIIAAAKGIHKTAACLEYLVPPYVASKPV